jgi:alkylation response protein AidB-like acyl-CoA dehydrogenase
MYDIRLTDDQLEISETVRDFVAREVKPVVLHPDRLQDFAPALPWTILEKASRMGLRASALSLEAGGAGADTLTSCLIMEELAAGDVAVAAPLGHTSLLSHVIFDRLMSPAQRERFLQPFLSDDRYHLAFAGHDAESNLGWFYHRPRDQEDIIRVNASRQGNGDWVVNGTSETTLNAPIAKLIAVQVKTDAAQPGTQGTSILLVPCDTPGLSVRECDRSGADPDGGVLMGWDHGSSGELIFSNCRVPADFLLGREGQGALMAASMQRGVPEFAAINLGVGQAAYEAAVNYAKLRRQGGCNIIEHEAIGTILAELTIKLEVARNMIWKAAWVADHPDDYAPQRLPGLPLGAIAKVFTSEIVHEVTLAAEECFGGMGVMRDMPLHKYVHDGLVFLHGETSNSAAKLRIAEVLAGYERSLS